MSEALDAVIPEVAVVNPEVAEPAEVAKPKRKRNKPAAAEAKGKGKGKGKKGKPAVAVAVAEEGRGPGRPPVYTEEQRAHIVALLEAGHTQVHVQELLSKNTKERKTVVDLAKFPKLVKISLPTIAKIGQRAGLTFTRGRRKAAA